MKCVCCNSIVESIDNTLTEEESVFMEIKRGASRRSSDVKSVDRAENRMWGNGVVSNISAGYGSIHDGDRFVLAICDKCVTEKKNDGTIAYTGNYMGYSDEITELDKFRKIWRRNSNLDKLI